MSNLKFADSHNMVTFLAKPTESEGFEQIIDFLNANPIKYALTVNPTIYTSCIEQFWATAKTKTVNGEVQLQALVDGKKVIITETSVRRVLKLKDAEGIECLPNADIFEQLTLMGYEKLSQKLTFYKAFFSPQWKFLIHTILQCLSAKTTAWNEFSSTMASAIICLATNQKFNFSKYIFDNMVKNLEGGVKFLMYPRRGLRSWKRKEGQELTGSEDYVVSSDDEGLGDQEDASKQGSKIADIDADIEVTLVDDTVETQGRFNNDLMFDTDVSDEQEVEVEKEVSTVDPVTTAGEVVTTTNVEVTTDNATTTIVDELTLAQTLIEIKDARPKVRGVMIQEPSEFTTTTTITPATSKPSQDKGKAKMIEPEMPLKKKD
ncbi:hypothetical protein Tco_0618908 [Tanacetum coccineum]